MQTSPMIPLAQHENTQDEADEADTQNILSLTPARCTTFCMAIPGDRCKVRELLVDGVTSYLSSFVRMEYLRSRVMTLIDLYFVLKDEETVPDGIRAYTQTVAYQNRRIAIVLDFVINWLLDFSDANDKIKTLRRLGDAIVRMVFDIDDIFEPLRADGLACELGRVAMRRESFNEQMMLNFYSEFRRIQQGVPKCGLCVLKVKHHRSFAMRTAWIYGVKLKGTNISSTRDMWSKPARLERVPRIRDQAPKCSRCKTLGDSIICALALETEWRF